MIIAINAAHFLSSPVHDLIIEHWLNFAALKPGLHFVFIVSKPLNSERAKASNITTLVSTPRAANALAWKWWLNYTLPSIAKKHNAAILIHSNGTCSLRCNIPQCMLVADFSYHRFPQFVSKKQGQFLKKQMPLFIEKTDGIVVASAHLGKELAVQFPIAAGKTTVIPLAPAEHFKPMGWQEKENIKEKYTSGKEYFLFSGELHPRYHLVNLLKAFSFFKTRQKSNMQLVITAPAVPPGNAFIQSFGTYKYRNEVSLLFDLPATELSKLTAAAYAFVYPVFGDDAAVLPLQAMQCEVPVIATADGALHAMAADAALYANPDNSEELAGKMMLLFKDELARTELISAASKMMQQVTGDKSNALWEKLISETVERRH